jgi:hypothetical protein
MMNHTLEVTPSTFNALPVTRVKDTIFVPLPKELWRKVPVTACGCDVCKHDKTGGYYDTLAVGAKEDTSRYDGTWTVHYPSLHSTADRKAMAYLPEPQEKP